MGSVRRVLPRLLVLAGAAAAVVVFATGQHAHAQQPDPLGGLVAQVGGVLPPDPVQTLTAPLEPITSSLTSPPPASSSPPPAPSSVPPPPAADPVQTLTAPLQPATTAAGQLLDPAPVVGTLSGAVGDTFAAPATLVVPVTQTGAPITNAVPAALGHVQGATSSLTVPSLPGLGDVVAPLTTKLPEVLSPELTSLPIPELAGPSLLAGLPGADALVLPGIGAVIPPSTLAFPSVVPELLALPGDAAHPALPSTPMPLPNVPLPLQPATTVLDVPTAAGATLTPGGVGYLERVFGDTWLSGSPAGGTTTAGEAFLADPIAGPGPARGPPEDAPRDPPQRGSTHDARSVHYSTLPGTDEAGVTRGESWLPGTDVELTNPQPEPSVSPD